MLFIPWQWYCSDKPNWFLYTETPDDYTVWFATITRARDGLRTEPQKMFDHRT
jgi:hypothetical protein